MTYVQSERSRNLRRELQNQKHSTTDSICYTKHHFEEIPWLSPSWLIIFQKQQKIESILLSHGPRLLKELSFLEGSQASLACPSLSVKM